MEKEKNTTKNTRAKKPAVKKVAKAKEIKTTAPVEATLIIEEALPAKDEQAGSEQIADTIGGAFFDESTGDAKGKKSKRYFEATGRRKSAVARVRLFTIKPFKEDEGRVTVNGKFYKQYFPTMELQQIIEGALRKLKSLNRFEVIAKVNGGGIRSQSEAIRHGLARTLILFNIDFRKKLKKAGYLKRDPRVKERKKYGLKSARRAPQWAKR